MTSVSIFILVFVIDIELFKYEHNYRHLPEIKINQNIQLVLCKATIDENV